MLQDKVVQHPVGGVPPGPLRGEGVEARKCADISVLFGTVVIVYVSLSAKTDELLKKEKHNYDKNLEENTCLL